MSSQGRADREASSLVSSCKGTDPITGPHPYGLITSQTPCLLIPSH